MKLSKAKEIMKINLTERHPYTYPNVNEAIQLLIESASWMLLARVHSPGTVPDLLHGETKE